MFDITSSIMMRRSSSTGSSSSALSLSPVGWNPNKSAILPPSITAYQTADITTEIIISITPKASTMRRSLSPEPCHLNLSSSHQACAFPSWPARDFLTLQSNQTPTRNYISANNIPNSRITDDELESLDFSRPQYQAEDDEAVIGISWSAINNPTSEIIPALQVCERRLRLPPPPAGYRRRSSSRKSPTRKSQKQLGAITE